MPPAAQEAILDYIREEVAYNQNLELEPGEFWEKMFVHNLMPDPIPEPVLTSAFIETNVKTERDLDSSVVWKVRHSLQSAVDSFREEKFSLDLDSLAHTFREVRNDIAQFGVGEDDGEIVGLDDVFTELKDNWLDLSLYHPVMVVEGSLWVLANGQVSSTPWCRLQGVNQFRSRDWWFDVVDSRSCPDYFRDLTKHYAEAITSHGGQLLDPKSKRADILSSL